MYHSLTETLLFFFCCRQFWVWRYSLCKAKARCTAQQAGSNRKDQLRKKVLRTEERDNKVHIYCSDNTTYEGDILIGADGAYSGVRQSLYRKMDEKGILPKTDLDSLSIAFVTMVGVANPPNPEKYPQLKDNFAHFTQVLGEDTRSVSGSRDMVFLFLHTF
jgi:2-polyprenyl-6-methoxyphenol hydroxylase-like FAD-dependent oxidoreductase